MTENQTEPEAPQWATDMASLYLKMSRVMSHLERVPKRGENKHFGYAYVTDSDVLDAVRKAMAEERVAFFVDVGEVMTNGKRTTTPLLITFADGDTGATKTINWLGEADDSQDKGINKAITAGVKYCLLKTFLMSTGDDDDPDGSKPVVGQGAGPQPPRGGPSARPPASANDSPGAFVMPFGKHKNKTLSQIADSPDDADYLKWVLENIQPENAQRTALLDAVKAYLGMTTAQVEPPNVFEPTGDPFLNGDAGHAADIAEAQREMGDLEPHWIKDPKVQARFWGWTGSTLGLTHEQVHQALDVEHVEEYDGTMDDAKAAILKWVDEQSAA